MSHTDRVWILTRKQRGAGRATAGIVVEAAQLQATRCEFIEIGRLHFAPIAADVRVTKVICHDVYDVGTGGRLHRRLQGCRHQEQRYRTQGGEHTFAFYEMEFHAIGFHPSSV